MLVNKLATRTLLNSRIAMKFGGGHHHHVYDWRDDHAKNPDFYEDPRMIGVRRADTFVTPYKEEANERLTYKYSHPDNYNPKDLTTNYVGTNHFSVIQNYPEVPQNDYMADVAHEFDYESQDLDFQPESFETQHFRKQGPIWIWVILGLCPLWFFANELFVQYWPDADIWRYQRPPPFNYPSEDENKDLEIIKMFKSFPHQQLYDAGITNPPYFEVVNGKKVYSKWAGVNQPRDAL